MDGRTLLTSGLNVSAANGRLALLLSFAPTALNQTATWPGLDTALTAQFKGQIIRTVSVLGHIILSYGGFVFGSIQDWPADVSIDSKSFSPFLNVRQTLLICRSSVEHLSRRSLPRLESSSDGRRRRLGGIWRIQGGPSHTKTLATGTDKSCLTGEESALKCHRGPPLC